MRTAATKATKSHSVSVTRTGSFFRSARSPGFFSPVMRKASGQPLVQTKLSVSKPADPLEKEADRTADRVMLAAPVRQAQRVASAELLVQRFGEGTPTVADDAKSEVQRATTGGQALPTDVRGFMEPRVNADLGDVRVHADESAASLSNHLSARAFTYRNHVFFARDQYQPGTGEGRHLLAHELAHTIQQGATVQRTERPPEVQRAPEPTPVTTSGSPPAVQRLGVQDALDYFADKAYYIPGFRMLTLILGFNPINMRSAPRTAANFLRALIELIPGGPLITRVLDNHGVINKAADWVEQKVATLGDIGGMILDGLRRFIDSLSWTDIFHLGSVWDRAKRIFTDPIDRLISFGVGVVSELLDMVKQAILRPLAALAEGTPGYDLLKAILKQDPITGEPVPRTADTLIGGFMKLIRQEEVWQNIKRGNAVARAFAWFQGALTGLMAFVLSIPGRIMSTLRSLTFEDVLTVVGAFRKIGAAFIDLVIEFGGWAVNQVISLLEILFSVVKPGVMPYITKAKAAFRTILRNPVAFIGNLVRAAKLGFETFAGHFLTHLKNALIKWITGPLGEAGVYIPQSFSLLEIVKLVLSVLGLTWQNIRTKLLKIIPDPVLAGLEKTAGILATLVTQGPAAAWEQIKAELTELKDQLISQVSSMIQIEVVKAAVKKLVSMLNPAGAVIQAIIAIYNTVTFFIEKAKQIGAVVAAFIDSIASIAAGVVTSAAKRVEQTLANTLVVVIAFLAKFAGLGGIPEKLVGIVKKIRAPIDKGLDKIVAWLGKMLVQAGAPQNPGERVRRAKAAAVVAARRLSGRVTQAALQPVLAVIQTRYALRELRPFERGGTWWVHVLVNPNGDENTGVPSGAAPAAGELTELSLWESVAGRVTQAGPPEIRLSPSSAGYTRKVLEHLIDSSPAPAARKATVRGLVSARIATAEAATDSHAIYVPLQQAAGIVNSLYPGPRPVSVVHHEQEVHEYPETFVETRHGRIYVSRALRNQVRALVQEAAGLSAEQRRAREQELASLIRSQIQDQERTALTAPLDEIDLLALTERVHVDIHRRRRAGR